VKVRGVPIGMAALFGILGAGCGGNGGAPSRADFIAEADDICRNYADRFEEINADAGDLTNGADPDPALVQDFLQDLVEVNEDAVDEVRDLSLPDGDAGDEIDAALDEVERANSRAQQLFSDREGAMAYFTGEDEEAGAADPFAGVDEKLTDAGYEVCFTGEEG
jgi:hypothetical protein